LEGGSSGLGGFFNAETRRTQRKRGVSMLEENEITDKVIGAAIEVHRHLGPGLLESAYDECLCYELSRLGVKFERQVHLPIDYKGLHLDCAYRLDLVVEGLVIVEMKAIEELLPIHKAQVLTYLKASNRRVGLLINFNVPVLINGLKRMVNHHVESPPDASLRNLSDLCVSAVNRKAD
jgi:GxxExxY protein